MKKLKINDLTNPLLLSYRNRAVATGLISNSTIQGQGRGILSLLSYKNRSVECLSSQAYLFSSLSSHRFGYKRHGACVYTSRVEEGGEQVFCQTSLNHRQRKGHPHTHSQNYPLYQSRAEISLLGRGILSSLFSSPHIIYFYCKIPSFALYFLIDIWHC